MSEIPIINEKAITAIINLEFDLTVTGMEPICLGADRHSWVYCAQTTSGVTCFVKLRTGEFKPISVTLPHYLHNQGVLQVIPPIQTKAGDLWVYVNGATLVLYPYIENRSAAEVDLSPKQWRDFGRCLKKIHRVSLPPAIRPEVPQEDYAAVYRQNALFFLEKTQQIRFSDPVSRELADFLLEERQAILDLVDRAETLARIVMGASLPPVLCHSDIHEANLLMAEDGRIYLVDWDDPILAPKERDLMFIGGGVLGRWKEPQQVDWFYQGYGSTEIHRSAQAYYRCERIITDIAVFCERILKEEGTLDERGRFLQYLRSNFQPGGTLDIAYSAFNNT